MGKALKLNNKRFGKLLVIKDVGKNTKGDRIWLCQCDCGKQTKTSSHNLVSGHTSS